MTPDIGQADAFCPNRTTTPGRRRNDLTDLAPSLNPIRADAAEDIPVIDLAPYLAGEPEALERTAQALRHALENIGFYFITGHGVDQRPGQRLPSPPLATFTPCRWKPR